MDHETSDATALRLLKAFFDRRNLHEAAARTSSAANVMANDVPAWHGPHLEPWPLPWQGG
jgi:hypothetical protein